MSLQIRALERLLGHRLLDRRGRKLSLTDAGTIVYRYANRMLSLEDELAHELDAIGHRVAGRLVIGSSTGLARSSTGPWDETRFWTGCDPGPYHAAAPPGRSRGDAAIDAALDAFYVKILADPRVNGYFDGVDMVRLKGHAKAFLTMAFGGPSHYMGRMFYCSQPLERPADRAALEVAFRAINAQTQLVWGSNFPSHDFDVPSTIWDLPFLAEETKKAILGGNAMRLFGFENGGAAS